MSELIRKQDALNALGERPPVWTGSDYELGQRNQYDLDRLHLELVPSAQPKTGKWTKISPAHIYECSVCGQQVLTADIVAYKFCNGCGARMKDGD